MTFQQQMVTIAMVVIGTMITRFLPFLVFSSDKPAARPVQYIGSVLPGAMFGLLVIYCLKDVSLLSGTQGIPEMIAIAAVIGLHLWKRQMLLSIAGGTLCYIVLLQLL